MQISGIPFGTTDWALIEPSEHKNAEPHRSHTQAGAKLFIVD